jgi:hypothetical protein
MITSDELSQYSFNDFCVFPPLAEFYIHMDVWDYMLIIMLFKNTMYRHLHLCIYLSPVSSNTRRIKKTCFCFVQNQQNGG